MTTWINSREATAIISANSGRPIQPDYVRLLARSEKIKSKLDPKNKSRLVFSEEDCKAYTVARTTDRRVTVRVRDQRSGKPTGRPRKANALPIDQEAK